MYIYIYIYICILYIYIYIYSFHVEFHKELLSVIRMSVDSASAMVSIPTFDNGFETI